MKLKPAGSFKILALVLVFILLLSISISIVIPDIRFLIRASLLPAKYKNLSVWAQEIREHPFSPTTTKLTTDDIADLEVEIKKLATSCKNTWFIKHYLIRLHEALSCESLEKLSAYFVHAKPFLESHLSTPHTYLVLFQNSEELRASGGFMGSFARLTVSGNGIEQLEIQDIYEPDGQFTGYIPAPPGVFEYLSSGNGLRLPDANWAADFPSAAQTILAYFSFGKQSSVDGLIAINSSLIEKILASTGDIYLPDYQTNISATTFTTLARSNRDEFFPGSKQKQHFLTSFMTQLKLRLSELSSSQQQELLTLLLKSIQTKDTLFYSTDPDLQSLLQSSNATGSVSYPQSNPNSYLYLLESNVGINKANKQVERQITLELDDYQSNITLHFENKNPTQPPTDSNDDNLNYANYQRVLVPASWQLLEITINGQKIPVETIDDNIITTKSQDQFRQVGFLIQIQAQTKSSATITFSKLATDIAASKTSIFLQKQPGQKATPYTITWRGISQTLILDQDTTVTLQANETQH